MLTEVRTEVDLLNYRIKKASRGESQLRGLALCMPRGELRDSLDVFGLAEKGLAPVTCASQLQFPRFVSSTSLSLLVCKHTLLVNLFFWVHGMI